MNDPVTLIHKKTTDYGFGYCNSDHSTERLGRGLTYEEQTRVRNALEAEANRHNPEIEALGNV